MNATIGILRLLLIGILSTLPLFAQTGDNDVIKVDSSIVVINAAVTDASGKAVRGLLRNQFRVFEDGNEQEIKSFGDEETPFAAVILLDTSGSMESRVTMARSAAIQFLAGLRNDDVAAIYNFYSKVELVQDFSNTHDMRDQVFDLKADGMTTLNDAIFQAASVLSKRPEKRRAIIVLSDGADTFSKKSSDTALRAALDADATIYAVDMAPADAKPRDKFQSQAVLKNFAEKTGGKFIATPGGAAMRDAFKKIADELGVQYTISYEPNTTKKDGKWRSIELRVKKPNLMIRTRKGYHSQLRSER